MNNITNNLGSLNLPPGGGGTGGVPTPPARQPGSAGVPAAKPDATVVDIKKQETTQQPAAKPQQAQAIPQDARHAVIEQAALKYASETFYPVSSTRFTIYKAPNGEFVTRFTDLSSGSVTYIPEPELMQLIGRNKGESAALVETFA